MLTIQAIESTKGLYTRGDKNNIFKKIYSDYSGENELGN